MSPVSRPAATRAPLATHRSQIAQLRTDVRRDLRRVTRTLDPRLWAPLGESGVLVDVRRGDASDPLAGFVRFEAPPDRPVDVIVGWHEWQTETIARARRSDDRALPVVQPRDLVLLKPFAGGTQDLWDVHELLALPGASDLAAAVETDRHRLPPAAREAWTRTRGLS